MGEQIGNTTSIGYARVWVSELKEQDSEILPLYYIIRFSLSSKPLSLRSNGCYPTAISIASFHIHYIHNRLESNIYGTFEVSFKLACLKDGVSTSTQTVK